MIDEKFTNSPFHGRRLWNYLGEKGERGLLSKALALNEALLGWKRFTKKNLASSRP
jgi:hypothetical protein